MRSGVYFLAYFFCCSPSGCVLVHMQQRVARGRFLLVSPFTVPLTPISVLFLFCPPHRLTGLISSIPPPLFYSSIIGHRCILYHPSSMFSAFAPALFFN